MPHWRHYVPDENCSDTESDSDSCVDYPKTLTKELATTDGTNGSNKELRSPHLTTKLPASRSQCLSPSDPGYIDTEADIHALCKACKTWFVDRGYLDKHIAMKHGNQTSLRESAALQGETATVEVSQKSVSQSSSANERCCESTLSSIFEIHSFEPNCTSQGSGISITKPGPERTVVTANNDSKCAAAVAFQQASVRKDEKPTVCSQTSTALSSSSPLGNNAKPTPPCSQSCSRVIKTPTPRLRRTQFNPTRATSGAQTSTYEPRAAAQEPAAEPAGADVSSTNQEEAQMMSPPATLEEEGAELSCTKSFTMA